jgi:hypothetical protein
VANVPKSVKTPKLDQQKITKEDKRGPNIKTAQKINIKTPPKTQGLPVKGIPNLG